MRDRGPVDPPPGPGPRDAAATPSNDAPPPLLLTVDETAALLRTTRKAVYALVDRAQLPGVVRLGRRVLVHRGDLLRWIDERRATSPGRIRR